MRPRFPRTPATVARMVAALGVAIALVGGPAATTTMADYSLHFYLTMGECHIYGDSSVSPFQLVVRDASGRRKASLEITPDLGGNWSTGCLPLRLRSGYKLIARDGDTVLRSFVIPPFGVTVNRVTNVLRLSGPPNEPLAFILHSCFPPPTDPVTCYGGQVDATFQTDGEGRFEANLDDAPYSYDVKGGDSWRLDWTAPAGDTITRYEAVWAMLVEVGNSRALGVGRPGRSLGLVLRSAGGELRGRASATVAEPAGNWAGRFRRDGSRVRVRVGDRVLGDFASDASLKVRDIRPDIDLGADTIGGTCYPSGRYGLKLSEPGGSSLSPISGQADGAGLWDETLPPEVVSGWRIVLWCATTRGDAVRFSQVVP